MLARCGIYFGDMHAMQGDGEIAGHTTDVSGTITVQVLFFLFFFSGTIHGPGPFFLFFVSGTIHGPGPLLPAPTPIHTIHTSSTPQ